MAAIPTPSLITQATAILDAATKLQHQLEEHGLRQPAFEADGRRDWQDAASHPDVLAARSALVDASNLMLNLALGPMDVLSALAGPAVSKIDVFRTLDALGVAEAVPSDETGISLADLAAKVGVHAGRLHQQLRFAYLMGLFHEPREGFVAHTAISAAMPQLSPWTRLRLGRLMSQGVWEVPQALRARREDAASAPADDKQMQIPVSLADAQHRDFWRALEEDDAEGRGMQKFSAGMKALFAGHSGNSFAPLVQGFDWAALGSGLVVDIGGGNGHIEVNIVNDVPSGVEFLIQDLATNEAPAQALIEEHGVHGRVKFQVHDFFTEQPVGLIPRAYLLSRVLHDWQDADCLRILKPLVPAMSAHDTKLFVTERILPDRLGDIPNHKEQLMRTQDLLMFTLFGGGERSLSDWDALFKKADSKLRIAAVRHSQISLFSYMEVVLDPDGNDAPK